MNCSLILASSDAGVVLAIEYVWGVIVCCECVMVEGTIDLAVAAVGEEFRHQRFDTSRVLVVFSAVPSAGRWLSPSSCPAYR